MSKICDAALTCPFAPEQTTTGCICAELCPGFVSSKNTTGGLWYSYNTSDKPPKEVSE